MRQRSIWLIASLAWAMPALAAEVAAAGSVEVSKAWTPAVAETGIDHPLYMTIANKGTEPDALLRFRCPVAQFSEKRTTDYGEGSPHAREVKAIPIPANETVVLEPGAYHLMLLQTTRPLKAGETFSCSLSFRNAGSTQAEIRVVTGNPPSAP